MREACYDTEMHFFMSSGYCICYTDIDVQKESHSFIFNPNSLCKDKCYIKRVTLVGLKQSSSPEVRRGALPSYHRPAVAKA